VIQQILTVENLLVVIGGLGWLLAFLQWIEPKTKNQLDDEAVAAIEKARQWAMAMSPNFWAVIEWSASQKMLPAGATKATEFLLAIRKAYLEQHGHDLPVEAEKTAQTVAMGLSAAQKIPVVAISPNPPLVPASR